MSTHKNMKKKLSFCIKSSLLGSLFLLAACSGTASTPVPPGTESPAGYGSSCKAGMYSCKTPYPVPLGSPCSCPGVGAASYGNVHAS
ncbi:hypothetical protein [Commensalibacter oyaizuii]|uniref:Lipoprotein n=1 Tax=Commensalibacter oyaizuii TaxID=3043873 RepID=A0ABT6PZI6_9PROT|nr:hypothetical protein [Commensalibacter sp. TBRC 16381]MDI2090275.1 hypothetical protein [Commensalibacter sp. TBRC 16381]